MNHTVIKFDVRKFDDDVARFDNDYEKFDPSSFHDYVAETNMDYGEEFNIMKFHDVSKNMKQYVITAIMQEITKGLIKVYVI